MTDPNREDIRHVEFLAGSREAGRSVRSLSIWQTESGAADPRLGAVWRRPGHRLSAVAARGREISKQAMA